MRVTQTEKQAMAIQAVKLQREALRLSRYAYLDEMGACEFVDAAAKLEQAAFQLRFVALAVRRELADLRSSVQRRVA